MFKVGSSVTLAKLSSSAAEVDLISKQCQLALDLYGKLQGVSIMTMK